MIFRRYGLPLEGDAPLSEAAKEYAGARPSTPNRGIAMGSFLRPRRGDGVRVLRPGQVCLLGATSEGNGPHCRRVH